MNKAIFATHLDSLQEIIFRCLPSDLIPQWLQSLPFFADLTVSWKKTKSIVGNYSEWVLALNTSHNEPFTELGLDLQYYIFKSLYFSSCTLSLFWDCYSRRHEGGNYSFFLTELWIKGKNVSFLTANFSSADYTDRTFLADFQSSSVCIQLHLYI